MNLTLQTKPKALLTREAGKRDEKVGRSEEEPRGQVKMNGAREGEARRERAVERSESEMEPVRVPSPDGKSSARRGKCKNPREAAGPCGPRGRRGRAGADPGKRGAARAGRPPGESGSGVWGDHQARHRIAQPFHFTETDHSQDTLSPSPVSRIFPGRCGLHC